MKTETKTTPKAQHTAGEWRVNSLTDTQGNIVGSGQIKSGEQIICSYKATHKKGVYLQDTIKEAEANAKLIAAAPELLECLIELSDNCKITNNAILEFVKKSRNVIKKATE